MKEPDLYKKDNLSGIHEQIFAPATTKYRFIIHCLIQFFPGKSYF